MTDPVTTALAVQMEYGDDELKKDIDERISEIVRREIRYYLNNNSFEIAQQVKHVALLIHQQFFAYSL